MLFIQSSSLPTLASVVREDNVMIEPGDEIPIYQWKDNNRKPRALALAIHGLIMHGGLYDVLARRLAAHGFIVMAPDLRGYGRWLPSHSLDYEQSYEDLVKTAKALKMQYPNLPLYLIGESLGAGLALHLAAAEPGLVDGLVLSSPAIKRRSFYGSIISCAGGWFLSKPHVNIDLIPYIRRYASEDPRVIQEALGDPLIRKKLTALELLKTSSHLKAALAYANRVSESTPVLILQGSKDRVLKSNAVLLLLKHLKSKDQTVRWFNERGHLLLETAYAQPDTLKTVEAWLLEHASNALIIEARNKFDGEGSGENSAIVDAIIN